MRLNVTIHLISLQSPKNAVEAIGKEKAEPQNSNEDTKLGANGVGKFECEGKVKGSINN